MCVIQRGPWDKVKLLGCTTYKVPVFPPSRSWRLQARLTTRTTSKAAPALRVSRVSHLRCAVRPMAPRLVVSLACASALLLAASADSPPFYHGLAGPLYTVLKSGDAWELRDYPPSSWARARQQTGRTGLLSSLPSHERARVPTPLRLRANACPPRLTQRAGYPRCPPSSPAPTWTAPLRLCGRGASSVPLPSLSLFPLPLSAGLHEALRCATTPAPGVASGHRAPARSVVTHLPTSPKSSLTPLCDVQITSAARATSRTRASRRAPARRATPHSGAAPTLLSSPPLTLLASALLSSALPSLTRSHRTADDHTGGGAH